MKKFILGLVLLSLMTFVFADASQTHRELLLKNAKVNVWKTMIYPSDQQILKMHRHDFPRVLIALSDGTLEIVSDKGVKHLLKLKNEGAYYLNADVPGEMHTDKNISNHPIKVIVIELH